MPLKPKRYVHAYDMIILASAAAVFDALVQAI